MVQLVETTEPWLVLTSCSGHVPLDVIDSSPASEDASRADDGGEPSGATNIKHRDGREAHEQGDEGETDVVNVASPLGSLSRR